MNVGGACDTLAGMTDTCVFCQIATEQLPLGCSALR